MVLVLTFILFLMIFLIIVDFFAILFRLTGVPIEKARFQVTSLLTGTGFTTKESELAELKQVSFKIHRFAVLKLF